ncbi:glycosyl hydrolase [Paludibacter sp.]
MSINKNVIPYVFILLLFNACTDIEDVPIITPPNNSANTLFIVDKNATAETRALLSNLWKIQSQGFMFGHHDDLWYGRTWYNEQNRSDTKDVCGDYPAVFSFDLAEIMDDRYLSEANSIRRRVAIEAYDRGEVLMACCHLNNPLTGGDAWDNTKTNVVSSVLSDDNQVNQKFKVWLDRLADFANNLKGTDGKLIPIIFRPFHEHTQSWSWWGNSCTSEEEFIRLWRFTISYLKDTKGVHNLLYAISPQIDSVKDKEYFLYRWPGNDYVDFLGIDSYHGLNPSTLTSNLSTLSTLSREIKKPCGITETGVEGIQRNNMPETDYWTKQILAPASGQFISMIVMWRNKYDPKETGKHFFSVFKGHPSENDFIKMYNSQLTFFSNDLPDMYKMAEGVIVK